MTLGDTSFPVRTGDTVLIPPGSAHCIGAGFDWHESCAAQWRMQRTSVRTPSSHGRYDATRRISRMTDLGPRLAAGGTAELFAWEGARVVKLYWEGATMDAAEREAARTRAAREAGAPAAQVFDVVKVGGRPGVVFEKLDGALMLDAVCAHPERMEEFAAELARLQASLHQLPCEALPPQREHMTRRVQLGPLPARVKPGVVQILRDLPDQRMVCHGDLHPGNVILTADGPRLIDWFDATAGCPAADLARTCLLLNYARLATGANPRRAAFDALRAQFVDLFLQRYREILPEPAQTLAEWMPPVAAARIAEPISGQERSALLRMIETLLTAA